MAKAQEILCSFSSSNNSCLSQLCLEFRKVGCRTSSCCWLFEVVGLEQSKTHYECCIYSGYGKIIRKVFFSRGYLSVLLVLNDYLLRDFIKLPFR